MLAPRWRGLAILILAGWLGLPPAAEAAQRVVLVLADGLSLESLLSPQHSTLNALIKDGGMGLLNTRTGKPQDVAAGYVTLGAGARGVGAGSAALGSDVGEALEDRTGLETYRALMGTKGNDAAIVLPYLNPLRRANDVQDFHAVPGLLGASLAAAGKKVALYGNADVPGEPHREAVLVAMDEKGSVALGSVAGWSVRPDVESVTGFVTDVDALSSRVDKGLETAQLIVVETGDLARLNRKSAFLSPERLEQQLESSLSRLDALLGKIKSKLEKDKDLLLVVSPSQPNWRSERAEELTPVIAWGSGVAPSSSPPSRGSWGLTPVIAWGSGIAPGSLLVSPSTRTPGLVANTDIAPTILRALSEPVPFKMSGRPIYTTPSSSPVVFLLHQKAKMLSTEEVRKPVLTAFVFTIIGLFLLGLLQIVFSLSPWLSRALPLAFLWLLTLPLSFLIASLLPLQGVAGHLAGTGAVGALLTGASLVLARGRPLLSLLYISAATVLALVFDAALGSGLGSRSVLGHSGIIGARFYGIGNEHEGVLLAASIVAAGAYAQLRGLSPLRLALMAVGLSAIALAVAHPQIGANVGGTIAVVAAFGFLLLRLAGVHIGWRQVALLGGLVVSSVIGLLALDSLGPSRSHAGLALLHVQAGGWTEALDIVQRKLAMNLKLIRFTVWSQVLIAGFIVFAVLLAKPPTFLAGVKEANPHLTLALGALVVGTIIAFIFNDSGVVAAATSISFGIASLLYLLVLAERPANNAKLAGPRVSSIFIAAERPREVSDHMKRM